ncbi:amino acid adenylation domain-containing protein [Hahella sp. NBU794]|uniref:amino acid adenylation domain-containing protein n=1 Tax=Hahella sp. NBU794 TaxID=3422590 RepID=UPI003D6EF5CA
MQSIETKGQLKVAAAQRPEHGKYWRSLLAEPVEKSLFHPDRVKPSGSLNQRYVHTLDADVRQRLHKLSGGKTATRQVVMLAALAELLRRYTGSDTACIGQPLQPEQTKLSDYLALRIQAPAHANFKQLLGAARDAMLAGLEFCDYPLTVLADEFGLEAEKGGNPFFDVALEALEAADDSVSSQFQCRVLISHFVGAEQGELTISYDDGLFDADSIQRIAEHFETLLLELSSAPDAEVTAASITTPADEALLQQVNATEREYRRDVRLETVFAEQVAQTPDAAAVVCGQDQLTYAQLNDAVNSLAAQLRAAGVAEDQLVAVAAERSTQVIVAILAILRAGGAYLPIDPGYPANRIQYVLENSGASVILTHRHLLQLDTSGYTVIDIDEKALGAEGVAASATVGGAENLAYAIYTSGSTGKPKGVLIEHHSVINRIAWMQNAYPLTAEDVILQKTPISFDVSVWELFWWFFTGSRVCMLEPGGEREPEKIVAAIEANKVTTMHFVPSMLNAFLDYVESTQAVSRLQSLRKVFTSGEALTLHQAERFKKLLHAANGTRLINLYGPTEATVDVTHLDCTAKATLDKVTIGSPIDNTQIHIVDKQLRRLPIGVPGELCIAGVGLARGYHALPEMTADRFVTNPENASERWYRTGDLARWLGNGEIEYLGRLDHQVKVRGFRIELQEIDAVLRSHPAVRDAVTLVHRAAGLDKLVAYVTVSGEPEQETLRQHVAGQVPAYMVPDMVIVLEQMPLSPNGKLDRKALPSPVSYLQTAEYTAPRNRTEEILADIWREVLQLPRVGVHDNFFAIGGNSIHFVTVLAKARKFDLEFTFQQLFANPTIATLAQAMEEEKGELQQHRFDAFELLGEQDRQRLPQGVDDAYPLSMLQAGLIFQNELTFGTAQYHDIISYIIESPINLEVFKLAADILVKRNPIFRTSYHLDGFDEYIQMVHTDVEAPLYCHDLRGMSEEEQEQWHQNWLAEEKAYRFEWNQPGLVRLHVHVLRDNMYRYVLSQHNSALDGWSITLVHTQLFRIYNRLLQGGTFDEPLVDNHIRNYIGLEAQSLRSVSDRAFWENMLDGATYTRLPKLDAAQPVSELSVLFHEVDISKQLSDRIIALADQLAVPVKTLLMAAHLKFLSVVSGDADVMTGYEHSGRPEAEDATKAIGLFLNTVPFRVDVDVESWAGLIQRVYQAEAALLPHRRYPMARMKQDIGTQEPLFDTAFNYTHFYLLKELKEMPEFNLLDVRANSETEFAIRAEFCRHFFTDDVKLSLHYHEHAFTSEQVENFAQYYLTIFESMTQDPKADPRRQPILTQQELAAIAEQGAKVPVNLAQRPELESTDAGVYLLGESGRFIPVGAVGDLYFVNAEADRLETDVNPALNGMGLRPTELKGRYVQGGGVEVVNGISALIFRKPELQQSKTVDTAAAQQTPLDAVEVRIAAAWAQALKIPQENIGRDDNFFDLGGNSLAAMKVTILLEGLISLVDLMRNSTLAPLADVARKKMPAGEADLLVPLTSDRRSAPVTLVCFPYAGGNAINFKPFAERLAEMNAEVQVFAVEPPGHNLSDTGEALLSVEEFAKKVAAEISANISGDVFIWGHCVGSAAALATAGLLQESGRVAGVFIGGKLLPDAERSRSLAAELESMPLKDVGEWLVTQTGYGDLNALSEPQLAQLVKAFRHDACGANRYLADLTENGTPMALPLTMVAAQDDPLTPQYREQYLGWSKVCESVALIELADGGHYFCRTKPAETAAAVSELMRLSK